MSGVVVVPEPAGENLREIGVQFYVGVTCAAEFAFRYLPDELSANYPAFCPACGRKIDGVLPLNG